MQNQSKTFEYQYIKNAGYTWKGHIYTWQNKPASACKEYKKVRKLSSYREGWVNWDKYDFIKEAFAPSLYPEKANPKLYLSA